MRFRISWLAALLFAAPAAAADPLHVRIDRLIAEANPEAAAAQSSDSEFLRRVWLDLTGSIPSASEARAFLDDPCPDKRITLIDKLLDSPEHARQMQRVFDVLFMDRRGDGKVPRAAWEEYLRASFAAKKPYDQLVRELLSTDGTDAKTRPAGKFLLDRDLEPTLVTRDISRLFLGRNLQCAQCHDHPLVDDYKQSDFYGIQAFFNRTFLFPNPKVATAVIAEKADGEVTFTSVFDEKKAQKTAMPRMLSGKPVKEPKLEKGKEYQVAPAKNVKPVPAYSRFAQLAAAVTAPENAAFRRTAANRIWALLMGRGLVHPLDYDHADNPPSHPKLLDLLAEEFAAHQYDVRWLLREIALSETYQRSSEPPASQAKPLEQQYRVAILKPLSPEQLAYSALQATGFTDSVRQSFPKAPGETELHAKLAPQAAPILAVFSSPPGESAEAFAASLDQTLFVKHGGTIRSLIAPRPGNLLDRCAKLTDAGKIADELFLAILTRLPTAAEKTRIAEVIGRTKDRPATLTNLAWALLASNEFRFNH